MPETLSQSQIDELLNRMRTGNVDESKEEPESKVKEYDFTSPKKFTKDQMKSLSSLYENFARVISSYYSSILRSVCEIEIAQIEEQRYYEFNNALPDTVLIGMVDFKPDDRQFEETTMMFDLSTAFGFFMIDRLLGGTDEAYIPDRSYTDVELALLNTIMVRTTQYIEEAWQNHVGVKTELRTIETNGRFLQAYSPQDIIVIVSMEVKVGEFTSMINICMMAESLDGLINNFSMRYSRATKQLDPQKEHIRKESVMSDIKTADLEMTAVLDECRMTLGEILQLRPGDVIALNLKTEEDIKVTVEGKPWYYARLGEAGRKKAIKIVDTIKK